MADRRAETIRLYQASTLLSKDTRLELGLRFPVKVYVQDPLVAEKHKDKGILGIEDTEIDWDPSISAGPTNARIAVVDYNGDTMSVAPPVAWNGSKKVFVEADDPEKHEFHQVNAWAIVQNTLAMFEEPHAMGRPIPWGFDGNRLIVIPHAGTMQNAFYDRRSKSLQFYYFVRDGKPIYTCLSHDIVSHESGHAILDGVRPGYFKLSSPQTVAFHEFTADLTAILAALHQKEVRQAVAKASKGNLLRPNVIADLAEQFGGEVAETTYGDAERYYLRTALNPLTMEDIADKTEPHYCSQVLTGAMYEILARVTKKLLKKTPSSPATALWKATQHLSRMSLRALDYCPPVDIQFSDYVLAVIRADELAYPQDSRGYLQDAKEVFTKRGLTDIKPAKPPYSVELNWKYDMEDIAGSRTAAYHFLSDNRAAFKIPACQDIQIADLYSTSKVVEADRRLPREIVLEYTWSEDVPLDEDRFGRFKGQTVPLWCGGTVVFDGRGNILHWCCKPGTQEEEDWQEGRSRRERLLNYIASLIRAGKIGLVDSATEGLDSESPAVLGSLTDGTLHLETTSGLLHSARRRQS